MADPLGRRDHILTDPYPDFLRVIGSDDGKGWVDFYRFAHKVLTIVPPEEFRWLSPDERDDMIRKTIERCEEDHFRRLRQYEDRDRPFAFWLIKVARNLTRTELNRRMRDASLDDSMPDDRPERDVDFIRMVEAVDEELKQMSERCRLMIRAAAHGAKVSEIAVLLGLSSRAGASVFSELRQCRRNLIKRLTSRGIRIELPEGRKEARKRRNHDDTSEDGLSSSATDQ